MKSIIITNLDENNVATRQEVPCHAERSAFAVAEVERDGVRYYTVTHIYLGLKAHPFAFGDLLAATECAEEMDRAFPTAASWYKKNTAYRSEALAIWERHMARDAYIREVEAREEGP